MADVLKAQKVKLANSRKRFKELQEKKRLRNVPEKPAVSPAISDDVTSLDNSNSPTHDFLNNERVHETPTFTNFASLPEPCDNVTNQDNHQQSSFFDHFVPNVSAQPNQNQPDDKSTAFTLSQGSLCDDITNLTNTEASQHVLHLDGPSSISSHFADPLTNPQRPDNMSNSGNLTDIPYREKGEIYNSSIESLQQLSNQINELVNPEYCTSNSITDLEKRNAELATQLEHERIVSGKQNALINDLRANIDELQRELREKVETCNTNMGYEVNKLREELQCHIQTIGMLVAEKTELSANLSQLELCSKQKSGECEELKARLKASRSRVADLEKEIGNLKLEKTQNETMIREQAQAVERLRDECTKLREQKNDDMQEILEVREKLKNSSEENVVLQQQIKELSSKVSLADIKIQQINNGEQTEGQLEKVMQEKFELEKQLRDASQFLRTITKERDESSAQYQQYVQQQNVQLISISNKMEQLQAENERLSKQDQARIKHINELEKQIQALQSDQVKYAVNKMNSLELKEDSDEAKTEKGVSEEDYVKVVNEKEMLLKELEAKSSLISEMESLVEQLQGSQSDSAKLLATIESDKVAAAIAVQQNRDLKLQLEGIQEVFLKLNNDKIELTEQLNRAMNDNKELLEKIQKTELHLQMLTDAIEIKDRELFKLQEADATFNRHNLESAESTDKPHYHESDPHAILEELKEAKEILELREFNSNETKVDSHTNEDGEIQENNNTNDVVLDKEVAMKYLEDKFKRTMHFIVELLEEKQVLEHIVMQLQGETETIGEYVTLYQQQRMILKQKVLERDQQLKRLAHDKEQIRIKLEKVMELIGRLFIDKAVEGNKETQQPKTAEEVLMLLSEIKYSNLISPDENVHHCPCCSGQLITV